MTAISDSAVEKKQINEASAIPLPMSTSSQKSARMETGHAAWDWRYGVTDIKANALYKKATSEQWQADQLNWDYIIDPSRNLFDPDGGAILDPFFLQFMGKSQREHFITLQTADTISQILHGEQGALMACCHLAMCFPNKDGKLIATAQAMDEARHIDVFSRYIRRLHDIYPASATLSRILDKVMSITNWQGQLVGIHIVIEGLALANFSTMRNATGCDLLRDMLRLIMRDEARHVAFGNNYIKSALSEMHPDDRAEIEDFAADLVQELRQWGSKPEDLANFFQNLIAVGVDPLDYIKKLKADLDDRKIVNISSEKMDALNSVILPGLKRVGLITDRVQARFLESELNSAMNTDVLEKWEESLLA